jgi:hypothetical protein
LRQNKKEGNNMCRQTQPRRQTINELIQKASRSRGEYTSTLFYDAQGNRALLLSEDDGWQYVYTEDGANKHTIRPESTSCITLPSEMIAAKSAATTHLNNLGYYTPGTEPATEVPAEDVELSLPEALVFAEA